MLLGAIIKRITKAQELGKLGDIRIYVWKYNGLSLGKYIFVPFDFDCKYLHHEYGHSMQSEILGWFYLPFIGLPSLIWARCFEGYRKRKGVSYYAFYTERWADKLGGVER